MRALIAAVAVIATPAASMAQYNFSQPTYRAPTYNSAPSYIPRSRANDAIPGQMQQRQNFQMQQQIDSNTRYRHQQQQKSFY